MPHQRGKRYLGVRKQLELRRARAKALRIQLLPLSSLTLLAILLVACSGQRAADASPTAAPATDERDTFQTAAPASDDRDAPGTASPIRYTFRTVNTFPHDPEAFTQGLDFENGFLYEGTGLRGESTLRRVDLDSGEVLQMIELDADLFGEGITAFDGRIVQLTLTSGVGYVYEESSMKLLEEFSFTPEGWGLTFDGESLIISDGTSELRFLDPETFVERSRILVTDGGEPVLWLNELEWIDGEIYANVWQFDTIARISPLTGEVLGWIDLEGLRGSDDPTGVLNGIAYDSERQRLFVTGKNWPQLYEIELIEIED